LTTYSHPVIIIQGTGNGLGIARNLGSLGIKVYCLTSNRWDPTIHSKYCTGSYVVPRVEEDPATLKTALTRLARKLPRTGVLFPTGDLSLLTLASIIDEVDDYVSFLPRREVIKTLVVKKHFYTSLRAHGVPHPRTLTPDDIPVDDVADTLPLPVYLRPSHSARFSRTFHRKGFIAHTMGELRRYLRVAAHHDLELLIQEIVPGPTSNGYVLKGYCNARSEPLLLFASQKIRQPSMFSNPTIHKSVPLSDLADFSDVLVPYLKTIGYRGLFGAEVKRDAATGVVKLLEINARSMGCNYFPVVCGVNSVLLAYLDVIGEETPPVNAYAVGVYRINLVLDALILLRTLAAGHFSRATLLPYVRQNSWNMFSTDDPLPFFFNFINLF
jgi:D-aspartate ligase